MKRTKLPTYKTCSKISPDRRTPLEQFIIEYEPILMANEKQKELGNNKWRTMLSKVIEKEKENVILRYQRTSQN